MSKRHEKKEELRRGKAIFEGGTVKLLTDVDARGWRFFVVVFSGLCTVLLSLPELQATFPGGESKQPQCSAT